MIYRLREPFFRCVVDKHGCIVHGIACTYDDLIAKYKRLYEKELRDVAEPELAHVSMMQPKNNVFDLFKKWQLRIDSEKPSWLDAAMKRQIILASRKIVEEHVLIRQVLPTLGPGRYWLQGCQIEELHTGVVIEAMTHKSIINNLRSGAVVKIMCGKSTIVNACGTSVIEEIHDQSKVKTLQDDACVKRMYGKSRVSLMLNNSTVSSMHSRSGVNTLSQCARINEMRDLSTLSMLRGAGKVDMMLDNARVRIVKEESEIKEMRNSTIVHQADNKDQIRNITDGAAVKVYKDLSQKLREVTRNLDDVDAIIRNSDDNKTTVRYLKR